MKKLLFTILFTILILYSCFFPQITLEASKTGIRIWFQQILPALLPFTILSSVLIKSNFLQSFSKNGRIIALFLTVLCGFVFGFPIGAKLSSDFYKSGLLSEKQALTLTVLCNNFSPMYVCGYVLPTLFTSNHYTTATCILIYGVPLFFLAFLFLVFFIQKQGQQAKLFCTSAEDFISEKENTNPSFQLNMSIMDAGIITGFEALIRICGYIILFSIIANIFNNLWNPAPFAWNFLLSNLEITNGIYLLSQSNLHEPYLFIFTIQLLTFGGLSGLAQTASVSTLSISKYIIGKVILSLLLTILSILYVF